eukprot:TRINITY_DN472_c0_g1_i1.p1 TRINITY_DN472_c0_g1~~TRINITY_DN472_c0_g1_i1.p1  ORF type:complete len:1473 (+),score=448.75 TRINITY_DN472_c0_g1_i1:52-4470(+)
MSATPRKAEVVINLFQSLLVPELRLLGQEAKKKHPPLKEACERAAVKLGTLDDLKDETELEVLKGLEEVWRPLLIACDCKSKSLVTLALGALQKLVSHELVLSSAVPLIVTSLGKLKDLGDESVHLKVLQCLMALFSSSGGYELSLTQMPLVFNLSFSLYQQKNYAVVQSTAAATLSQITTALFDKLETKEKGELERSSKSAFLLIKDLCTVVSGETGQYVKIQGDVPKMFIFELIYNVVRDHSKVMASIPQFVTLVKEDLSLVLAQSMQSVSDLPLLVRIYRTITVLLQRFPYDLVQQQELFINLMIKTVDFPDVPAWHKVVVLTCWRELAENYLYLKKLYHRFDHNHKQANLFESLVTAICNVFKKAPPSLFAGISMSAERVTLYKLLAIKSDEEILIKPGEPVVWAIDTIVAICKSLSKLVEIEGRPLTDGEVANDVEAQQGENLSAHMLACVWQQVLGACTLLLDKSQDEEIIEETLRCFKQFTHACGKAGLDKARDEFIAAMNKFTLPSQGVLSAKNMQVLRVLFDVANGLGGVLDSSWYLLLTNFQQLDFLLSGSGSDQTSQSDIALIRSLLSKIFEGTKYFDDSALLTMVSALCKLSAEVALQQQSATSPSSRGQVPTFALQRLAEIAVANVLRLQVFWEVLHDHLEWLVKQSENEQLRKAAVETASQTVLSYLYKYRQPLMSPPVSPATPLNTGNRSRSSSTLERIPTWLDEPPSDKFWEMQPKVVAVLRDMRSSGRSDVAVGCLNLIFTVMQRAGQDLVPTSWRLILSMLSSSSQTAGEVPIGFKSVVLVCSDFMPILDHDGLQALIQCVGQFSQQIAIPDKTNTNLSAIQQTLSIADFCSSHPTHASPTHWNSLFVQLRDAASDSRPEVRHSAMKTLFTALVTHGNGLPSPCWNTLFWDVLLKILDNVHSAALTAEQQGLNQELQSQKGLIMHHSRNTAAKQWYETRCTVLDGVARLIRVFYSIISKCVSRFAEVLNRMAVHLANASLHSTEEVANVGLRSLQYLLVEISNAAADQVEHPAMLWEVAMGTWERLTDTSEATSLSTAVLTTLAEGLADLCNQAYGQSNEKLKYHLEVHTKRVLTLLDKLMKSKAASDTMSFPSKMQLSIIRCVDVAPVPKDSIELKAQLLVLLCSFLPSPHLIKTCASDPDSVPKQLVRGEAQLCERVLVILNKVYCSSETQNAVKMQSFDIVLQTFGAILLSRHFMPLKYEMWRKAVEVMPTLFDSALRTFKANDKGTAVMWKNVVAMLKGYLTYGTSQEGAQTPENPSDPTDECDVAVLGLVHEVLMPFTVHHEAKEAQQELMGLVDWCCKQRCKRTLSDTAMKILFKMCEGCEASDVKTQIGCAAMPVVASQCRGILTQYLADSRLQNRTPLPKHRHDEVLAVFNRLASTEFTPVLFTTMQDPPTLRTTCPAAYGPRGLSVRLLPILTEFVTCNDEQLTKALQAVLYVVTSELGLVSLAS